MATIPPYIKSSSKIISNPWKNLNASLYEEFVALGRELEKYNCSLYFVGSVAGSEECEKVGDIDIAIFFEEIEYLSQVDLIARPYRNLEGTNLPIRFQFYPKSFVKPYIQRTGFNPVYYTAIKTINDLIYGEDILKESDWLEESVVKDYSRSIIIENCLMVYRRINKQKWTIPQNKKIMNHLGHIILNLMYHKGFFGYSKNDIYALVNSNYSFKNNYIPNLMLETRESGSEIFIQQDPQMLQTECLKFCQEILDLFNSDSTSLL